MKYVALAVVAVAALARSAYAGDADCSYVEVLATSAKDATIDPDLKPLEKRLKKAPFASWNAFRRLSSGSVALDLNKSKALSVKSGATSVMLRERSAKQMKLSITIDDESGKRLADVTQIVDLGDWVLFVGVDAKNNGHIVGLTCK
jgi:hypothetical protein